MIASFPMYDRASTRAGYDAAWALIRDNLRDSGIAAPEQLNRDMAHMKTWAHPELVLGQICNLPLRAAFAPFVTVIGAADYGLPDTPAGHYHSVFIVHADSDLDHPEMAMRQRFAVNDVFSQSGFGAAQAMVDFDIDPVETGAHKSSLDAVVSGDIDCASIDVQTWRHLQSDAPHKAAQVRVIGRTPTSPGMSMITAGKVDPDPYFAAISAALTDLPQAHRTATGWQGIIRLPARDYDLPVPERTRAANNLRSPAPNPLQQPAK